MNQSLCIFEIYKSGISYLSGKAPSRQNTFLTKYTFQKKYFLFDYTGKTYILKQYQGIQISIFEL